ncbi:MAG: hypothetical protein WCI71_09985 [Bacteroidota bacterium]
MKKPTLKYRMMLERQKLKISDAKLLMGSLIGKYPVVIDGSKTIIYISDKSKESETKIRYASRMDYKRFISPSLLFLWYVHIPVLI